MTVPSKPTHRKVSLLYLQVPTLTTMQREYEVIADLPWWKRIELPNLFYNMLVLGLLIATLVVTTLDYDKDGRTVPKLHETTQPIKNITYYSIVGKSAAVLEYQGSQDMTLDINDNIITTEHIFTLTVPITGVVDLSFRRDIINGEHMSVTLVSDLLTKVAAGYKEFGMYFNPDIVGETQSDSYGAAENQLAAFTIFSMQNDLQFTLPTHLLNLSSTESDFIFYLIVNDHVDYQPFAAPHREFKNSDRHYHHLPTASQLKNIQMKPGWVVGERVTLTTWSAELYAPGLALTAAEIAMGVGFGAFLVGSAWLFINTSG